MKLAEAVLEKKHLDSRVKLLESRVANDLREGRPTTHLQQELQKAANQARDLTIAIDWTEQTTAMSGLPLGAYRTRIKYLLVLAEAFEKINQEKADAYWESATQDIRILEAATWLVDLKIPGSKTEEDE